MKQVYGIYKGCKFEGGGCDNILFSDIKFAREECLKYVKQQNDIYDGYNEKMDDDDFDLYVEVKPNVWETQVDVVMVKTFNII